MTADDPLPTPPSSSASGAAAASGSQTTDPGAAPSPTATTGQQTAPAAQQQQQQQAQPSPAEAIEALLQQILASNNEAALAGTLLNSLGSPDTRESILSSLTPAGTDPLEALEAAQHTIGSLFILCVLVSSLLLSPPLSRALPGIALECGVRRNIALLFMDVVYCWQPFFFFFGSLLSASRVGLLDSRPHQPTRPQFRSHTSRTSARI